MVSLYAGGDDRLVKNAIELFDESRIPDGITQSRYPGALPQFIPPFSLFWIGMMHDLWWYSGDRQFLKPYLPGARGVLQWFEARLAPSGLLGKLEWWNYADWVAPFKNGEPPMLETGESAILSLQFVLALREAADLEAAFGSADQAAKYRALATKVAAAVAASCWDTGKHLLADTPAKNSWTQHANLLGVLADALPQGTDERALMTRVLEDKSLTRSDVLLQVLPVPGHGEGRPCRSLPRSARAVEGDARPGPDDVGGTTRADPFRLACLERAPDRRPSPYRRGRGTCGSRILRSANPAAPRRAEHGVRFGADASR